ncbi:hypothetical protein SAZ11_53715 [Streptomyces sp. FXJ1.4098]|nr:hypothetical protein [Streptomyces sp. FXJ1.4098]
MVDPNTLLVLATALVVRTTWRRPFDPSVTVPRHGPWAGRTLAGLFRTGHLSDEIAVAHTPDGPLTVLRVEGTAAWTCICSSARRATRAGRCCRRAWRRSAGVPGDGGRGAFARRPRPRPDRRDRGELGRGARAARRIGALHRGRRPRSARPRAAVRAQLRAERLARPLPGISAAPLAISAAKQSATATFGALGFRAAAVTAMAAAPGGVPPTPPHRAQLVHARFDRPFGFLAVHRASGLVLMAGWVGEPEEYRDRLLPGCTSAAERPPGCASLPEVA